MSIKMFCSFKPDYFSKASLLHKRIILVSHSEFILKSFHFNTVIVTNSQPVPWTLTLLLPTVANTRGSPSLLCQLN